MERLKYDMLLVIRSYQFLTIFSAFVSVIAILYFDKASVKSAHEVSHNYIVLTLLTGVLVFVPSIFLYNTIYCITHEFGHAIIPLIYSKNNTYVNIGSNYNKEDGLRIKLGKLHISYKYLPIEKFSNEPLNTCLYTFDLTKTRLYYLKYIISTAAGAIIPCLMYGIVASLSFIYDFHFLIKFHIIGLFVFSLVMLRRSYIFLPHSYNDWTLIMLWNLRRKLFYISTKNYVYSNKVLESMAKNYERLTYYEALGAQELYTNAITLNVLLGNLEKAKQLMEMYIEKHEMNDYMLSKAGMVYIHLDENEKAMDFFNKALRLNPRSAFGLAGKGKLLGKLGKNDEASECYRIVKELSGECNKCFVLENSFIY